MEKEKIKNNDSNILVFVNGIPIIESISNEEKIMLASKYERVIFELFERDNEKSNCKKRNDL
ncbi:MAG: hypothetical protein IKA90_05710 [Clostridia bacterium]|nr:hypothetical protein [Clostridia bacterium]